MIGVLLMIISYNEKEKELLARIMRAEALNEGEMGMILVGDVVINRCKCNCYIFKNGLYRVVSCSNLHIICLLWNS